MTSREAMLFMKYEHSGKCKGSFKDSQRKCKYTLMTFYFCVNASFKPKVYIFILFFNHMLLLDDLRLY